MSRVKNKLKEVFELTIEKESRYAGELDKINYYDLFCKAASNDCLYKIYENNFCMFNCYYEKNNSVLMIFAVPINPPEDTKIKQMSERVMKIIKQLENCFIILDYINAKEVTEDKFIYVTVVKKIGE